MDNPQLSSLNKRFITQDEIEELKRIRQEEWDRVRKPEEPKERPEVEYDSKSLFERLKEQKDKEDAIYEERKKFKNQIRGINDDESSFLDNVFEKQYKKERDIEHEELVELAQFREDAKKYSLEQSLKVLPSTNITQVSNSSSILQNNTLQDRISLKNLVKSGIIRVKQPSINKEHSNIKDAHSQNLNKDSDKRSDGIEPFTMKYPFHPRKGLILLFPNILIMLNNKTGIENQLLATDNEAMITKGTITKM
ncbi:PSME3-interacting protein-like isoform X2 [Gordionus sp. m RMFG-2023]|uniref:PSME3-interacting protein-like isoform X2 n=1 Tax=Gordionus sp. m RMFG-2023 TaxID=3053472 RepID=UPI0031FDE33C